MAATAVSSGTVGMRLRFAFADCRAAAIFMMPEPIELSFGVPIMTPASQASAGSPRVHNGVNGSAKRHGV